MKTKQKRISFADDFNGVGTIQQLKVWWDLIKTNGPHISYHANPHKSWLIVKEEHQEIAEELFLHSKVQITTEGCRHLGAVIGSTVYKQKYMRDEIQLWIDELLILSEIAKMYPHAAYAAYTHGFQHRYTYLMRTIITLRKILYL